MEVKIGVLHAPREIVLESNADPEDIEKAVDEALNTADRAGVLALSDERGRRTLVPAAKIAYVEIGARAERRVGFTPE